MANVMSAPSVGGRGSKPFDFRFQKKMADCADDDAKRREAEVSDILARMRKADDAIFERNSLSPSQHYLEVRHLLNETRLLHVARMMPKGAHLHIHFNSMLLPDVLLGYAKDMANMYVWSDYKLTEPEAFDKCRLEFRIFNLNEVRKTMHERAGKIAKVYEGITTHETIENEKRLGTLRNAAQLKDEAAKTRAYDELGPNIFSKDYPGLDVEDERAANTKRIKGSRDSIGSSRQGPKEMRYQYFRELWEKHNQGHGPLDDWLIKKITFCKDDIDTYFTEQEGDLDRYFPKHRTATANGAPVNGPADPKWPENMLERVRGSELRSSRISARKAWTAFNGRTKMMKGLFNYESAFRRYTRQCLEEFVKDNVQYAEIRPNFMPNNQIYDDEGKTQIDNFGTMRCIIEEYESFMKDIGDMTDDGQLIEDPRHRPTFSGMKVIYCTPRSFSKAQVRDALSQCIEMKLQWPDYIAGFDLVGEEAYAEKFPLAYFTEEFTEFKRKCDKMGLDIPFLFHCGETPDDLEGNLDTALALGSKRIGHGYALPKKPDVLEGMKKQNVCVEACPISNMVLGLARRMDQHSMYTLLDRDLHCTVSSDNGTLFKSTLSHDFFEVMAGNPNINLFGWKQLAKWSIQHSCLSEKELSRMLPEWERRWQEFIDAIAESSSPEALATTEQLERAREKAEKSRFDKLRLAQSRHTANL